ncbi:DUF6174 domain-containing protein [Streptomyces sp. NPDC001070]
MTKTRVYLLLASAGLGLAAVGCGAGTAPSAGDDLKAPRWSEPDRYSFRLLSESGERSGLGEYRITVGKGKVVDVVGLDEQARRTVEANPEDVPTLAGLLTTLQEARAGGADVARAVFAPDGHPTEIHVDWRENAVDDEADYLITEYRPLDRAPVS